jgi:hypothetical protein
MNSVTNEIVNVTHVLAEDRRLRKWFLSLESLSAAERNEAFTEMAEKMTARKERPAAIAAVSALASTDIYSAVRSRVHELIEARRFRAPTLKSVVFVAGCISLASFSIYFLVRSLTGDQSTAVVRYFWPGIVCFLAAVGLLIFDVVSALGKLTRKP